MKTLILQVSVMLLLAQIVSMQSTLVIEDGNVHSVNSTVSIHTSYMTGSFKAYIFKWKFNEVEVCNLTIQYNVISEERCDLNNGYYSMHSTINGEILNDSITLNVTISYDSIREEDVNITLIETLHPDQADSNSALLHAKRCKSPVSNEIKQEIILNPPNGTFDTSASCSCGNNENLYYGNGSRFNGNAVCNELANWVGCYEAQCWFGPTAVKLYQGNYYANDPANFVCNFTEGIPSNNSIQFWIAGEKVNKDQTLESRYNGDQAFCKVVTDYTKISNEDAQSSNHTLKVYYVPNVLDSTNKVHGVGYKEIFIYFEANDKNDNVSYYLKKNDTEVESGSADKLSDTLYNVTYKLLLQNSSSYGTYTFTAFTSDPEGKDSVDISASLDSDTDPGYSSLGTAAIVGICLAAAGILILVILVLVIRSKRVKKEGVPSSGPSQYEASLSENPEKEERINPIYGSAVQNEKEERSNPLYGMASSNLGDATYTTVVKPKTNKKEKGEKINPPYKPANANIDTVEEAYAAVDKRKKKGGNENPVFTVDTFGDTYTEVNKKKKKPDTDDNLHGS